MGIKNKLLNPFALVGQGFLAGAILVYASAPEAPAPQTVTSGVQSAAVQQIAGI